MVTTPPSSLFAQQSTPNTASTGLSNAVKDAWKGRVVISEYMTGINCAYCQGYDNLWNDIASEYPAIVIPLAYHAMNNPPLSNPADSTWERMGNWYGDYITHDAWISSADHLTAAKPPFTENIGTDNLVDGVAFDIVNSMNGDGDLRAKVASDLKRPPEAFFHTRTIVKDGKIRVHFQLDSITNGHAATFLRIALVEDTVILIGDGKPLAAWPRLIHHNVVRAFAHTKTLKMGLPMKWSQKEQDYTFDVTKIQSGLLKYHKLGAKSICGIYWKKDKTFNPNWNFEDCKKLAQEHIDQFPDKRDWMINPLRLHVVVYVQDAITGEVLQAAWVNLDPKEAKTLLPPKVDPVILRSPADSVWLEKWQHHYTSRK